MWGNWSNCISAPCEASKEEGREKSPLKQIQRLPEKTVQNLEIGKTGVPVEFPMVKGRGKMIPEMDSPTQKFALSM